MKHLVCGELVVRRVDGVRDVHTACGRPAVYIRTYWKLGSSGRPLKVRGLVCRQHGPDVAWFKKQYGIDPLVEGTDKLRDDGLPVTTFRKVSVA